MDNLSENVYVFFKVYMQKCNYVRKSLMVGSTVSNEIVACVYQSIRPHHFGNVTLGFHSESSTFELYNVKHHEQTHVYVL